MSPRSVFPLAVLLAACVLPPSAGAAFPGQNGQIAYSVSKYDKRQKANGSVGAGALYRSTPNGSTTVALPTDSSYSDIEPSWSPDGRQLAYASYAGGKYDGIYVGTPDDTQRTLVAKAAEPDYPTWAPSGTAIAYTDYAKGLFVVDTAKGSKPRRLLKGSRRAPALAPAFSPDGKTIFYERQRVTKSAFSSEIWATDLAGAAPRRVLGGDAAPNSGEPDVSPDGARLVFSAFASDGVVGGIWTAGVDGSTPKQLVESPRGGFYTSPAWSPDGTKVVASLLRTSIRRGSSLVVIDAATGAVTTIRKASTSYLMSPSWQPLPAPAAG